MNETMRNKQRKDRGVSPVIGYALVLGMVVMIAALALLMGAGILGLLDDGPAEGHFEPEINTASDYGLTYVDGQTFDSSNTEAVKIKGENGQETVLRPDDFGGELNPGDELMDQIDESKFELGGTLMVIWINSNGDERLVSQVPFPGEHEIGPGAGPSGGATGEGEIIIGLE